MSGAITRLPGEKFVDFAARQRAAQVEEQALHTAAIKSDRAMRQSRRARSADDNIDHDHSMNG